MELFSEVKNKYFQLVFNILNECVGGKERKDILKLIEDGEFEEKAIGKNQQSFDDLILNKCSEEDNLGLLEERGGLFYPSTGNEKLPIPVRFTQIEKAWLKALLERKEVQMILSIQTYDKLSKAVEEIDTPLKIEYIEMTNQIKLPPISDSEIYEKNFKILLKALIEEKAIRYDNTDKYGNLYKDKLALPVSLEYSMRDGRFRASLYSFDDKRPIMANIFTLSNLHIVDDKVDLDRGAAKKILFEQKYSEEPIVLEVVDKKQAMERCFMCFSGMERTARDLGEGKYEIRLNYYVFEEENLVRNIISLGPYVKVLSPQRIVGEVIKRVQKSIALWNED